jgi:hypothetical protein
MSLTDTYPRLLGSVNEVRHQWRQRHVLEAILLTVAGSMIALLAVVALDNLAHPGPAGRLVLACLLWGTVGTLSIRLFLRRWLEDRRDDFFAALVEERYPELNNRFINALQLGRGQQFGSPRLIEAIIRDAAGATADLEIAECLDMRRTKRAALLALAALVLITSYGVAMGPRFGNGLARVLLPLADIPPYTLTYLDEKAVRPGDVRVPEGDPLTIEAKVSGVVPAAAQLVRRTGTEAWNKPEFMQADREASATFRYIVPPITESFTYYVAAGDGRSREYRVEMIKRPRVESLVIRYAPPAYTALPPHPLTNNERAISGLDGSRIDVEIHASKPLKEASLLTQAGELIPLESDGDGQVCHGSFLLATRGIKLPPGVSGQLVQAPTRYQAKLLDTDGFENLDPVWRPITLVVDQPPTVAITTPGRDVQARPDAALPLTVEAKDDYGLGEVRLLYRVNEETTVRELAHFPHNGPPQVQTTDAYPWVLARSSLKAGDRVQFWATAVDRNTLTGPGQAESRHFSLFVLTPELVATRLELQIQDFTQALEELLRLQKENRARTSTGVAFASLVEQQVSIRKKTELLARAQEKEAFPLATMIASLDELHAGLLADAVHLLEQGRDATEPARFSTARQNSLPLQDKIIAAFQQLLARLQRNEQAREALRKLAKTDAPRHQTVTKALSQLLKDLKQFLNDRTELAAKFEKMPKRGEDKLSEESLKTLKEYQEFQEKWGKWAKGKIDELAKLPTGFVDDFGLRPDANKIYEEIEKAAARPRAEKMEVSLEDLGAALATKMKDDLEVWMPDTPDAFKWVLEEPLDKKPLKIPEMPLPKALEDMVGDLLQKAEEFDEEADDITSAWGDNLDQAGWGVSDGPISSFSAKGKTGNDLPNNMEVTGRSGDGRQGKSTGQMVGDTAKALGGRDTPARVGAERYEPGQLKQEGEQDPKGATGGGKKAGAGRHGLQGGSPPDFVRDMGRLSEQLVGLREKAEQIARQLDGVGVTSRRLTDSIHLLKSSENDLRDLRYQDAARKRRTALNLLKSGLRGVDQTTAVELNRARQLPAQLRNELLQSAEEGYPAGYEKLLTNYFRALSTEK